MFVSELIKYKPFRDFLLQNFPKPKSVLNKKRKVVNLNPSLTGNSFEILYSILTSKKHKIQSIFEYELKMANRNINYLNSKRREIHVNKQIRYIGLHSDEYKKKIIELKFSLDSHISYTEEINKIKSIKFFDNTFFGLCKLQGKINLPVFYPEVPHVHIYDSCSLAKFYGKIIIQFELKALEFLKTRNLTIHFTKLLLQFTHISSPWFRSCSPFNNLSFESEYLSSTFKHFKYFNSQILHNGSYISSKPSLKCFDILATPDFMLKSKMLELKTSKVFFSSRDYLQALCYLLFAQQPINIKKYGEIKSIVIYYSQFNTSIEINIDDNPCNNGIIKEMKRIIQQYKHTKLCM